MDSSRFNSPVTLSSRTAGETMSITSASEAMAYLLNSWLGKRDTPHRTAVQACHDAISGEKSAATARRALVAAARQAGFLVSA